MNRPESAARVADDKRRCASEILDVVPAIMRTIRHHMREASAVELSVPHFRTLRFLSCHPGCSLSDVAEHIGLSLPSMSKIVQQLLTRGYVSRQTDSTDRRRTMLAPTEKGQRVLKTSREAARDSVARSIAAIGRDERKQVLAVMRILRSVYAPELGRVGDDEAAISGVRSTKRKSKRNASCLN